jgi:hypothetical protein
MLNESHPQRYPVHADPEKGQVHGGECNRTACSTRGATHWNTDTFGFYCRADAEGINEAPLPGKGPMCIKLDRKPTIEEMNEMHRKRYDGNSLHD